ncbi:MAG: hypothetical protein LBE16_01555, partial [Clostridiales Family XIII bacterium]|nr:hypothetical protein [Clostridiales Family XIII bacterium]
TVCFPVHAPPFRGDFGVRVSPFFFLIIYQGFFKINGFFGAGPTAVPSGGAPVPAFRQGLSGVVHIEHAHVTEEQPEIV